MSVLKQYREKRGILQQDMAHRLGLSQGVLSKYERGLKKPSIAMAISIEQALGPECPSEKLNPFLERFVDLYEKRRPRGRKRA